MERIKSQFANISFQTLTPPEAHPLFKYDGFNPSTQTLSKGHTRTEGARPFAVDTVFEKDAKMTMRDGKNLYVDVFRPLDEGEKVPALICWSPYGKAGGFFSLDVMGPFKCGVPAGTTSGYEKWEGLDPADWCGRGYAVLNPDARGVGDSEGDVAWWGPQEAEDMYDTIDWASKQAWCNGSVGFSGNSWLAISQLNMASRFRHPALKALAPWEGATDGYRDILCRGGIPNTGLTGMIVKSLAGNGSSEDWVATLEKRPLFDDFWETKVSHVENITDIPLYLVASYSSGLHSRGTFDTFVKAKTPEKWLRVHMMQEWSDLYLASSNNDLQKFFDRFCKNAVDNGWDSTPPVRLSLIGFDGSTANTIRERPELEWPPARAVSRTYYLDAESKSLSLTPSGAEESSTSYESHHLTDCADFTFRFDKKTELSGYPRVRLWMSCPDHDDMEVVVQIRKVPKNGAVPLVHLNYPCPVPAEEVDDTNVVKFLGTDGMLKASHRVSRVHDGSDELRYAHDKMEKIAPGTVVELEIPIWPIGMVFDAGEGMVLRVAGHHLRLPEALPLTLTEPVDGNRGKHIIHTGGKFDSALVVPVIGEE